MQNAKPEREIILDQFPIRSSICVLSDDQATSCTNKTLTLYLMFLCVKELCCKVIFIRKLKVYPAIE